MPAMCKLQKMPSVYADGIARNAENTNTHLVNHLTASPLFHRQIHSVMHR